MMQGITQQPQYTKCHRWSESEARPCNHRPRSCAGTLSGVVGGVEVDKCTTLNDDLRRTILVSAVHTVDQKVVAIQIAEWLAGEGTAVDDEGTLLNLHSSTAAVIVAVVDGHSSALPDVDAIAAVDAGINAAVGQSLLQFRNVHHRVSGVLVIGVVEAVALHGVLGGVDGDGDAVNRLVHVVVTGPSRPKWIQRPQLRVALAKKSSGHEIIFFGTERRRKQVK